MKSISWKRIIGVGLSAFALFIGSATLIGCETGEEAPEQEELEEGEELEEEE